MGPAFPNQGPKQRNRMDLVGHLPFTIFEILIPGLNVGDEFLYMQPKRSHAFQLPVASHQLSIIFLKSVSAAKELLSNSIILLHSY